MSTIVQLPQVRPNPYLRWMLGVGLGLAVGGIIWALIGIDGTQSISLLNEPERWGRAQRDVIVGASLSGYGTLLLMIAWVIAAAKYR